MFINIVRYGLYDGDNVLSLVIEKKKSLANQMNNISERIVSESPENWVILKCSDNIYKVFGTWAGGFLDGDWWRLNSGISKVDQDEDHYYFTGFSGSCYKCHKKGYGTATSYGRGVLNHIIEEGDGQVELMEDCNDWAIRI